MADDKVQPVPWVWWLWMRGRLKHCAGASGLSSQSAASSLSAQWPPLSNTAAAPLFSKICPCANISFSSRAGAWPLKAASSLKLGVTTSASGSSWAHMAATVFSSAKPSPEVATITGSSTTNSKRRRRNTAATASIAATSANMPIFTASMRISSSTASHCAVIISGGNACTARTPQVFCAVMAVMALAPYAPNAAKVFKSA